MNNTIWVRSIFSSKMPENSSRFLHPSKMSQDWESFEMGLLLSKRGKSSGLERQRHYPMSCSPCEMNRLSMPLEKL